MSDQRDIDEVIIYNVSALSFLRKDSLSSSELFENSYLEIITLLRISSSSVS